MNGVCKMSLKYIPILFFAATVLLPGGEAQSAKCRTSGTTLVVIDCSTNSVRAEVFTQKNTTYYKRITFDFQTNYTPVRRTCDMPAPYVSGSYKTAGNCRVSQTPLNRSGHAVSVYRCTVSTGVCGYIVAYFKF